MDEKDKSSQREGKENAIPYEEIVKKLGGETININPRKPGSINPLEVPEK